MRFICSLVVVLRDHAITVENHGHWSDHGCDHSNHALLKA